MTNNITHVQIVYYVTRSYFICPKLGMPRTIHYFQIIHCGYQKIMDLKNSDRDTRKQLTQKLLEIKDTRSPEYKKYITNLLYYYILKN